MKDVCFSLKQQHFTSHPSADVQWLLLFIKAFCCRWELSGYDSRMRMRCGISDQLWHCSNLKTEHKDKLGGEKKENPPVPQSLLFFLKHKHRQPTQQQHMGERALPVSTWRDIMPLCHSDVRASVIGECERKVRGRWVTVQTYTRAHIHTHTQVMQGLLLMAPVPYRHHPLLLASNPGMKKNERKGGGRGRVGQWRAW